MALTRAETIDAIARRYGVLPSAVLAEDADELFQMLDLLDEESAE